MHRSGTIMITRMLETVGLFVGKIKEDSHKAFFFRQIDEWLISQSEGPWAQPQAVDDLVENCELRGMADLPTYSIVLPAYNEGARIAATLDEIFAHVEQQNWKAEVIVVNDGSSDDTAEIVHRYAVKHPMLHSLENPGNRGKGYSVRKGMLQARGDVLLFSDADLSSPIAEADKLFAAIADGAEIAIGSRWLKAELQIRQQPVYRQLLGRIFNLALLLTLGLRFKDTQCGFKAFTRRAAHAVFPLQRIERWGFDPELFYLARKFGFPVREVPVAWSHREGSRIHPWRDGTQMVIDVFRIRWNGLCGKYSAVKGSER
jgi:dolichyl-phosphate beta-glucosyltransferase